MTEKRVLGTVTLPGDTASVRLFRRFVADIIGTYWAAGAERFDDVVLLTSESVTNSVVHSESRRGGVVSLTLIADGHGLRVEVLDPGGNGHRVDARGGLLSWFEV